MNERKPCRCRSVCSVLRLVQDLRRKEAARWLVNALIGALTGLIAAVIDISVSELSRLKFGLVQQCILVRVY